MSKQSKQAIAKEAQGYTKETPCCKLCKHYTSIRIQYDGHFGLIYTEETNRRCSIGGFTVSPAAICGRFTRRDECNE